MKLEEYETAKATFEAGAALAPGDSRFTKLIQECEKCIAEETNNLSKTTTHDVPPSALSPSVGSHSSEAAAAVTVKDTEPAKPKYRHEYYQKPDEVVVTIFVKGSASKKVSVDFGEQILSVSIDEDAYHFQPRLFGKIVPEKCKYLIHSTKIEIRLAKAEPTNWTSLEFRNENAILQKLNTLTVSQRPTYPSSKSGAVDWDKLEAEVKKEEKSETLDGDAGLNKLFRDIYQDADDDARRAMRKSFVESNGTVLSTNWKEVSSKKVEGTPPDGMELKKWEY